MDEKQAASNYLAPGESIQDSFESPQSDVSSYFVTDRRLIELQRDETSGNPSVSIQTDPLTHARTVHVTRVSGGSDTDAENLTAAVAAVFAGVIAVGLPSPESVSLFLDFVGYSMLCIGVILAFLGISFGNGGVEVEVELPSQTREMTLPPSGEVFAQTVAAVVGSHQT